MSLKCLSTLYFQDASKSFVGFFINILPCRLSLYPWSLYQHFLQDKTSVAL